MRCPDPTRLHPPSTPSNPPAAPDRVSFGETSFGRTRIGLILQKDRFSQPTKKDEYRAVLDFGNSNLKKKKCQEALVVYESQINAKDITDGYYDKVFLTGNGLNEIVTNLGMQRFAMSTNPIGGWVPGTRPL